MDNGVMRWINSNEDLSLIVSLNKDPESDKYYPNQLSRPVKSGHYVYVKPVPLENPRLVTYSLSMAQSLKMYKTQCLSDEFLSIFSGNYSKNSWATPYALSIYGTEIVNNCPFKNDTGYGDGRAISLTEVVIDNVRWELQLKGSGKTPFCRSGDGRAVLRSSVREFLVSEAMFHLNVKTVRALSLIESTTEIVPRPWFSCQKQQNIEQKHDIIQQTKCAILCRTASSFIRVGHLELFSRRVIQTNNDDEKNLRLKELQLMVEHTIFREYGHLNISMNFQEKIVAMMIEASHRFAQLISNWLRVGYVQGNFNSDNCHVGGLTMDYGPFGFMEKFNILWNPWINGGKKYAYLNQMCSSDKNFSSFVNTVLPLLDEEHTIQIEEIRKNHLEIVINECNQMWAEKLGFVEFDENVVSIKYELFELMENSEADFTLLWRQLCYIIEHDLNNETPRVKLFVYIDKCFYKELNSNEKNKWISWIELWLEEHKKSNRNLRDIAEKMKLLSPKFIPRESMLVKSYDAANNNDFSIVHELQKLFETPYDEHIDDGMTEKYYIKRKENNSCGANRGNSFIS